MSVLVGILGVCASVYVGFVVWILTGLRRLDDVGAMASQSPSQSPAISVVIAARNEAKTIADCLRSLAAQTRPPLEIIVVDDASEDETSAIALSQNLSRLVLLRNHAPLGKKPSLAKAIATARGDIVACTDADCVLPPTWLECIETAFQDRSLGFLSMPVLYRDEKTLFERCESLDFLALVAIGGALVKLRSPAICNGANIAYRRDLFFQTGGFGKAKLASGDDEAVMRHIFKAGYKVEFLSSERATVKTNPVGDWRAFFKQRVRWASKGTNYGEVSAPFLLALALIYLFNLLLFVAPLWAWLGEAWRLAAFFFALKFGTDFLAIAEMTRRFEREDLRSAFLAAEFLQIAYVALAPPIAEILKLGKGYEWKGMNRK
ncbi:MAG: glycosyltransferase [Chloroherpetonaceae bacterium]|nr:glycosyltransferase [Chloroherpetonaceae bacterium]MDW8436514.1 glycosyltransferase [Chloroherpetonaceae bacterium]